MKWITNAFVTSTGSWIERGYFIGSPKASDTCSVEEMREGQMIGVYKAILERRQIKIADIQVHSINFPRPIGDRETEFDKGMAIPPIDVLEIDTDRYLLLYGVGFLQQMKHMDAEYIIAYVAKHSWPWEEICNVIWARKILEHIKPDFEVQK